MPSEKEHSLLVDHLHGRYYKDLEKSQIRDNIFKSEDQFNKALTVIHQDSYPDMDYDKFKTSYLQKNGNPFALKKKLLQNLLHLAQRLQKFLRKIPGS